MTSDAAQRSPVFFRAAEAANTTRANGVLHTPIKGPVPIPVRVWTVYDCRNWPDAFSSEPKRTASRIKLWRQRVGSALGARVALGPDCDQQAKEKSKVVTTHG